MSDRAPLVGFVPMLAVATLAINDHVLKAWIPGVLTGKLSDVAGMVFFPLLLLALLEPMLGRRLRGRRHAIAAAAITAVGFAAIKVWPAATTGYSYAWAAMQWPGHAVLAWIDGLALPGLMPVACVTDATDLVALLALAIPIGMTGRQRERS